MTFSPWGQDLAYQFLWVALHGLMLHSLPRTSFSTLTALQQCTALNQAWFWKGQVVVSASHLYFFTLLHGSLLLKCEAFDASWLKSQIILTINLCCRFLPLVSNKRLGSLVSLKSPAQLEPAIFVLELESTGSLFHLMYWRLSKTDLRIKVSRPISDTYLRAGIHPRFILVLLIFRPLVLCPPDLTGPSAFPRSLCCLDVLPPLLGEVQPRQSGEMQLDIVWWISVEVDGSWQLFVVQVRMDASLTISDLAHPDTSSTSLSCKRVEEWRALRIKVMEYDTRIIGIQSMMLSIKVYDITQ